jgi:hypothetical protein
MLHNANMAGLNDARFDHLVTSQAAPPGLTELLELLRRGQLSEADVRRGMFESLLPGHWHDRLLQLRRILLSPQDLAMARQQEFIDDRELHARAALQGVEQADAELLFKLSGLPPGIGEGLELLRRGKIDERRFAEYVAEGHTKTKYTQDLLHLRHQPLSAAVAAELLIRERIPLEQAVKIAEENGLARDDFIAWSHGLGRPPGIMEALTLVNRKVMDKAAFHEVVARSDVRTQYVDDLYALRVKYPSLFQLRAMIANSSITDELAHEILTLEGYREDLIAQMIHAAHGPKAAHHKTISLSIAETLYESGLESREWFDQALDSLGYTPEQRAELENLLQIRRLVAEVTHALAQLRSRYTGWKIGRDTVVAEMDALLTDVDVRTRLLALWDMEREANRPVLTVGQVGQALRVGRYTVDTAVAKWQSLGLSEEDAVTHAWIVLKRNPYARAA